jgi:hypothetical protein
MHTMEGKTYRSFAPVVDKSELIRDAENLPQLNVLPSWIQLSS